MRRDYNTTMMQKNSILRGNKLPSKADNLQTNRLCNNIIANPFSHNLNSVENK